MVRRARSAAQVVQVAHRRQVLRLGEQVVIRGQLTGDADAGADDVRGWPLRGCAPVGASAADEVLTVAIAQIPAAHRRRLLVRADGAGASHGLLHSLVAQGQVRGRTLEYSVGFAVAEDEMSTATVPAVGPR